MIHLRPVPIVSFFILCYIYIRKGMIMEKNYYDWLEVNKNASNEIVEKAYKTLVKKYHPDLQEGEKKLEYEEILKHINEAYDTLSDPIKRQSYDAQIKENSYAEDNYQNLYNENQQLKNEINNLNIRNQSQEYQNKMNQEQYNQNDAEYNKKMNDAINKAYYDAYIQDLKNRGYKIKYKKTFKDYLHMFIAILVVILFWIILWQIPFIRNYFISLYNNNPIIHIIVDIFLNIFNIFKK